MAFAQAFALMAGVSLACVTAGRCGIGLQLAASAVRAAFDEEVELRKCAFAIAAARNVQTAARFVRAQGGLVAEPTLRAAETSRCEADRPLALSAGVYGEVNPALPRVWPNWRVQMAYDARGNE